MKSSDVEVDGVYRYTYSGAAGSPLNKRGPWLVGVVVATSGGITLEPVPGLPVTSSRPPAGTEYATWPHVRQVPSGRLDGRLCHRLSWDTWLNIYSLHEAEAAEAREQRRAEDRKCTINLVAALIMQGSDVGRGPWDRSTPWGQFVDDLRRREPHVVASVASAFMLATRPDDSAYGAAEAWFDAPVS